MLPKMLAFRKMSFLTCNLAIACFTHLLLFSLMNAAGINGLTIDMLHRQSPFSPGPTSWDWDDAYRRSMARARRFRKTSAASTNSLDSEAIPGGGEYYMKISIGTPPVETFVLADTGSDLTWIQCQPCISCYKQNSTIFNPTKSSTYRKLHCYNKFCMKLEDESSCVKKRCRYEYEYGDRSTTKGDLASETITVGSDPRNRISVRRFAIGCGHDNRGIFDPTGAGIVGLGRGPLSLISQLDSKFQGKFSHCLVPPNNDTSISSKFRFGQDTDFSGPGKVSTPLVENAPTTYPVTLLGISVGDEKVSSNIVLPYVQQGNVIVDSGTPLTLLPKDLYAEFESKLVQSIRAKRVQDPDNPNNVCYKSSDLVDVPIITFHFADADLKLNRANTFIKGGNDFECLTIVSSGEDVGIYGNIAMMNFEVGYDLNAKTVSFMPTDCTKQ